MIKIKIYQDKLTEVSENTHKAAYYSFLDKYLPIIEVNKIFWAFNIDRDHPDSSIPMRALSEPENHRDPGFGLDYFFEAALETEYITQRRSRLSLSYGSPGNYSNF